jgi:hypothetical protein
MADHNESRELSAGTPEEVVRHRDQSGNVTAARYRRPFQPLDATLKTVLLRDFARPALTWLFGPPDGVPPSMMVAAHAEVALALMSGIRYLEVADDESERPLVISAVARSAEWLVESRTTHDDGSCCWDHSAWDTSAVVRALCYALRSPSVCHVLQENRRASDTSDSLDAALAWLLLRLHRSETGHATDALNPGEYAEIGWAITDALMWDQAQTNAVSVEVCGETADAAVLKVCEALIRRRSEKMIEVRTDDATVQLATIWWGDFFGTSEVLRFYTAVDNAIRANALTLSDGLRRTIRESIVKCCLLIEHSHFDGVWGAYLDTIALLGAYVDLGRRPDALFALTPDTDHVISQPRIVFRVLRWMCDPTQRCSDGSILHTAFLTTFFTNTIIDIAQSWKYAEEPIASVYDEMCLLMETGVSEHRVDQINAILARDEALSRVQETERRTALHLRRSAYEMWLRGRIIATAVVVIAGVGSTVLVGQVTGWVSTTITGANTINVLTMVGLSATILVALMTVLWTVGHPPDDTDTT